jgi:uncharacterized membrane protein YdcZ (DUF606 family)
MSSNNKSESSESESGSVSSVSAAAVVVMRFSLSAWFGAALLFVITSVAEQVFPEFTSKIRDQLATIRFPWYYATGTLCCTFALSAGIVCRSLSRRLTLALVAAALASSVMAADYFSIYRPLQELIIPPGQPRTDEFEHLHTWSRNVNMLHLLLVLYAAIQASLPLRVRQT